MRATTFFGLAAILTAAMGSAALADVYLNKDNISVSVGPGTSLGSFNNTYDYGFGIEKVIDAPSADAEEFHDQATHIWFTAAQIGGGLELLFDFGQEYDISTLHFWNYVAEGYDVDNIDFTFFNSLNSEVGMLSVSPALGSSPGIAAQDIALPAPLNIRYVTAFLTGDNGQVDFQNIGFTAQISVPQPPAVPEPSSWALMLVGIGAVGFAMRRRSVTSRVSFA